MAKTKISEFDTNPDLNTDINSINIAENCSPANINNAIRQLMSDLKEWQSGAQDRYIVPAGTAAAPSVTVNGDLDTGLYSVGANELGVAADGSAVGKFTSAGFVGNVTGNVTGDVTGNLDGNLTAASPTAPTQAAGTNDTTVATTAFVQAALNALYPVGSIYINATSSTNPGTSLGFGTWVAFGAGRVLVGFDSSDTLFDSAEETGGSKDAIVVSHTHTGTTGNQSADHTHTGTSNDPGNFITGSVSADTGASSGIFASPTGVFSVSDGNQNFLSSGGSTPPTRYRSFSITAGSHTHTTTTGGVSADHNHSFTTASTGSSGTNANIQPYITVYMWKRTA